MKKETYKKIKELKQSIDTLRSEIKSVEGYVQYLGVFGKKLKKDLVELKERKDIKTELKELREDVKVFFRRVGECYDEISHLERLIQELEEEIATLEEREEE